MACQNSSKVSQQDMDRGPMRRHPNDTDGSESRRKQKGQTRALGCLRFSVLKTMVEERLGHDPGKPATNHLR
jgi:hypothetical protein